MGDFEKTREGLAAVLAKQGITMPMSAPAVALPPAEGAVMRIPTTEVVAPRAAGAPPAPPSFFGVPSGPDPGMAGIRPGARAAPAGALDLALPAGVGGGAPPPMDRSIDLTGVPGPRVPGAPAGPVGPDAAPPVAPTVPQPQYVGASFQDSRVPYKAATRNALDQTYIDEQDAAVNMARAKDEASVIQANSMQAEAARAQQALAERQKAEDGRKQHVESQLAKAQKAVDGAANSEVDPNRYFHNMSTFQHIARIVGVALGGGVAAATGGRNNVADEIDGAIQRDIDSQKVNLGFKQQNITNQGNMLGEYRQAFGDERLGELALEQSQREIAIQKMQAQAARSQSPMIQANAEAALAQLQQAQLRTKMDFERMSYVQAHMLGGMPSQHISQDRIVTMPDGSKRLARSDQEAQADRKTSGSVANIQSNIDKALQLRKEASFADLANSYSEIHMQLKSLQAETAQLVTVARGQGAMSKGDRDVADEAIGAFTGIFPTNDAVLKTTRARFGDQFDREMKAQGAEHVDTGYGADATGGVAPKAVYTGEADKPTAGMQRKVSRKAIGE